VIIRAAVVHLAFTTVLLVLAVYVQDVDFELAQLPWAFLFALPLGFATLRGGLGTKRIEYPSASFIVLGVWIAAMAPSFVIDHPDAHLTFVYSDQGLLLGRWLFFAWCLIFTLSAGHAGDQRVRLEPRTADVIAISAPIIAAISYQIIVGRFSNYQDANDLAPPTVGGASAVSISIGTSALFALPSFFLVVAVRARTTSLLWFARICFVLVWLLLFLAGGRSPIAYAVVLCFFAARVLGLKFNPRITLAAFVALPLAFFLVFNYRTALRNSSAPVSSMAGLTSVAVDSTQAVVSQGSTRSEAIQGFSDNARIRMWYGPQFFAVVDEWLVGGAGLHGTFLDGIIRSLPSWVFDSKNQLADDYAIETQLVRTGRFPDVDLGPTPWMQWLFELGAFGVAAGATLYGLLIRYITRRVTATTSAYEALFWYAMLSLVCSPEQVTDALVLGARNIGAIVCSAYLVVLVLRRLLPAQTARQTQLS
jgi:hypothetical protein